MYAEKDGKVFQTLNWESGTITAHRFVKRGTALTQFKAIAGATDVPVGVVEEAIADTKVPVGIVVGGFVLVEAGTGGVTDGKMVMLVDDNGTITDATPTYGTEYIVGKAFGTAAAGALVWIQLLPILP